MPLTEKQEGLVLRRIDYKDSQKILTLFTSERGIISLIVKGITRKNTHLLTLSSPLTHAEYLFRVHRSTLYTFQDGTLINSHLPLRQSLLHIESAIRIAQALLTSQLPGKPAPALYRLTLAYLKLTTQFTDPAPLTASFLLKLLKHEGILSLAPTCALCSTSPTYLHQGEAFCQKHTPHSATHYTPEEWATLTTLSETRQPIVLQQTKVPAPLFAKVVSLFHSFFSEM